MLPIDLPGRAPRTTPFERLGGRDAVERLVNTFYDRIEADPELRSIFPADLGPGRERQQRFLEEWLGGEPRYSTLHGPPMLRRRHFPFVISSAAAERWLEHMAAALHERGVDPALAGEIMQRLRPLALHMVNAGQDVPRAPLEPPAPPRGAAPR